MNSSSNRVPLAGRLALAYLSVPRLEIAFPKEEFVSDHYDVFCEEPTCPRIGDCLGLDANHGAVACDAVIRERAVFERIHELAELLVAAPFESELIVEVQYHRVALSFFAVHRGHLLRARSEYGHAYDECARPSPSRDSWCSLPRGHAGEDAHDSPPEAHRFDGRDRLRSARPWLESP